MNEGLGQVNSGLSFNYVSQCYRTLSRTGQLLSSGLLRPLEHVVQARWLLMFSQKAALGGPLDAHLSFSSASPSYSSVLTASVRGNEYRFGVTHTPKRDPTCAL